MLSKVLSFGLEFGDRNDGNGNDGSDGIIRGIGEWLVRVATSRLLGWRGSFEIVRSSTLF